MLSLIYIAMQSALAIIPVTSSQVVGKWSDIGCGKEYVEFKSGGRYEYRKWGEYSYVLDSSAYWWIEEGYIAIGHMKYRSDKLIGVIAIDAISSTHLSGAYATANGSQSKLTMIKCRE